MIKKDITDLMTQNHQTFIQTLADLSETDFEQVPKGKWCAGQQLDHIIKSVKPVNRAFGIPKYVLAEKFGKAKRPSRTYKVLVTDYLKTLEENPNYILTKDFAPEKIDAKNRNEQLDYLRSLIQHLNEGIAMYSEEELDSYMLPHPVMGKFTLRELLYFTMYHVKHHEKQIHKNLEQY
ncbi:DinB family protein [Croceitalea sp. MTPC5]|uniref:DinB family protein n=1 Tax=Croceitalea sp. MTPC5 TaxID=3056565 RepID=UPI002B3A15E6|nr:DinB family protein [Croceitalea sp. MTPC5]